MKKQLFALVGLGLLLATGSASAQNTALKANIPFNFIVNKAEMPAGEYILQNMGSSATAMLIESADTQVANLVLSNACSAPHPSDKTELVFHRYGNRYFLTQVWVKGEDRGRELPKSSRETEVAQDFPVQNVILALR